MISIDEVTAFLWFDMVISYNGVTPRFLVYILGNHESFILPCKQHFCVTKAELVQVPK